MKFARDGDSWSAGFITLAAALSLLAYRSIRVQNLSPVVALCIVMALWDLLGLTGRWGLVGGLGIAWGALFKLATAALLPLALALRRWRLLGWTAGLIVLGVMICWQMAGAGTFHEFFANIAPSLGRSSINPGNKSLQGFLLRVTSVAPLGHKTYVALQCGQAFCLALILWALFRPRGRDWRVYWSQPPHVFAAAAALLAWLLIFSPLCWEHYFMYLVPLWGWLWWEGTQSRPKRIAAIAAIATFWFPLPKINWGTGRRTMEFLYAGRIVRGSDPGAGPAVSAAKEYHVARNELISSLEVLDSTLMLFGSASRYQRCPGSAAGASGDSSSWNKDDSRHS